MDSEYSVSSYTSAIRRESPNVSMNFRFSDG